jgi:hypothetical protein
MSQAALTAEPTVLQPAAAQRAPPLSPQMERRCACGTVADAHGECAACRAKRLAQQSTPDSYSPIPELTGVGIVREVDDPRARQAASAPPIVHDVLASPGHPLDAESRAIAEPIFGHDFSRVRVHADGRAAESARAVNASAYTVGGHVVFAGGESPADLASNRHLLLHELAHTVQQQHAVSAGGPLRVSQPGDADERQADATVQAVLSDAAIPTLGPSSAHVARQPKTPSATAKGKPPVVDTMAGALVSRIIVSLSENRVAFQTSRGWVFGDVDTDLTEGSYELKPEISKRKWVISKPAVKTGLRFFVDLDGAIPWTLLYPATLPLTVTSGPLKTEEVEIPDPRGMGYNTIFKNAGPGSRDAVLALASVELPESSSFPLSRKPLIPDLEAYKKLEAPVRKSILALEPHAAGTACAGWFDVMRANDPDFKPTYTAEQEREAMAAYYGSSRQVILEKKVESAKADLPTLDPVRIDAVWKTNSYGLIRAAQAPNHGIKAEALHAIWINYWSDKYKRAEALRHAIAKRESDADFDAFVRKLDKYEDGDRTAMGPDYAKARAVIALGDLMFRHSVDALEICRAADEQGKSLTLDELDERVIDFAKSWDPLVQGIEQALTFGRGGLEPAKPEPVEAEPVAIESAKTEPARTEPAKAEPAKAEPAKKEAELKTEPEVKQAPEPKKEAAGKKETEKTAEPPAKSLSDAETQKRLDEIGSEKAHLDDEIRDLYQKKAAAQERSRDAAAKIVNAREADRPALRDKRDRNKATADRLQGEIDQRRIRRNALAADEARLAPRVVKPTTWQEAENALRQEFSGQKKRFVLHGENREVDCLGADGISREAKFGHQGLTDFIQNEITKDVELRDTGAVKAVEWHFYENVNGRIGPSGALADALRRAGIRIVLHK